MDERLGLGRRLAGRMPADLPVRPRPTDDRQEKLNDDWISTDERLSLVWAAAAAGDSNSMTTGFPAIASGRPTTRIR